MGTLKFPVPYVPFCKALTPVLWNILCNMVLVLKRPFSFLTLRDFFTLW